MLITQYNKLTHSDKKLLVFISDGTGLTSENIGLALMNQFEGFEKAFCENLPYIDTDEKAQKIINIINNWSLIFEQVIVFSTFSNKNYYQLFKEGLLTPFFDIFSYLLPEISKKIEKPIALLRGVARHQNKKDERAQAIDYALEFDDGQKLDFDDADIILLGLSRSGKTPTTLWLALHYGLKAANYPITEDDFEKRKLPENLIKNIEKCVLLLPSLERLNQLREERFKNSKYASIENCRRELKLLSNLRYIEDIPKIDVSNKSVEEIAVHALMMRNIHPRGRF